MTSELRKRLRRIRMRSFRGRRYGKIDEWDMDIEQLEKYKSHYVQEKVVHSIDIDLSDEDKENIEGYVRICAAVSKHLNKEVAILKHKKGFDFQVGHAAIVECAPRCIPVEWWLHIHPGSGSTTGPSGLDRFTQRAWGSRRIGKYLLANCSGSFIIDWSDPGAEDNAAILKFTKFGDWEQRFGTGEKNAE